MKPFNLLRACFYLLAALVCTELLITLISAVACVYGLAIVRTLEPGSCGPIRQWAQELWTEMLAAILALLLAGKGVPPRNGGEGGQ